MVAGQALRVGIVGTGHRARLYTTGVIKRGGRIVGLCDVNGERMEVHRRMVEGLGGDAEVFEIVSCWLALLVVILLREEKRGINKEGGRA